MFNHLLLFPYVLAYYCFSSSLILPIMLIYFFLLRSWSLLDTLELAAPLVTSENAAFALIGMLTPDLIFGMN